MTRGGCWIGVLLLAVGCAPPPVPAPAPPRAAPAPAVVPVLPETLGVSPTGRYRIAEVAVQAPPEYPKAARDAGVQGVVKIMVLVDTTGAPVDTRVVRSIPELDAAALDCVRRWRFKPLTWQGVPCRYRVLVPVLFTLH